MNFKRLLRVLMGQVAALLLDNFTGIAALLAGVIPAPFGVLAAPVIGAAINAVAKWMRDNSETYEFLPTPVAATARTAATLL